METVWRILEFLLAATAGGIVSRLLTIRSRVRQENAGASKAEEEAKADQIENVRKIVDEIYQPAINNLKKTIQELRDEVKEVRDENENLRGEIKAIKEENEKLKQENVQLRDALREIRPDVVPSKRSINAKEQKRNNDGTFAKEGK